MERRKFTAADFMEAVSAAHYYQYTFMDGYYTSKLPPVTSMFLLRGQPLNGQMHSLRHHCVA